ESAQMCVACPCEVVVEQVTPSGENTAEFDLVQMGHERGNINADAALCIGMAEPRLDLDPVISRLQVRNDDLRRKTTAEKSNQLVIAQRFVHRPTRAVQHFQAKGEAGAS